MESTESLQRKLLILKYQKSSPINDDHLTTENVKFLKRTVKHTTDTAKRLAAHKILETLKETKHTNVYIVQPQHLPAEQCDNIWNSHLSRDMQKRLYEDVADKEYRLQSWSSNWSNKVEQLCNQIDKKESKNVKVTLDTGSMQEPTSDDSVAMNIKAKFKRRKLENICKDVAQGFKKRRPHQKFNNLKSNLEDCILERSNPNLMLSSHQEKNNKLHNKYKLKRKMKKLEEKKKSLHFKIAARKTKLTLLKQVVHDDTKDRNINESYKQTEKFYEINDNQYTNNISTETDSIEDCSKVIQNIVSDSLFSSKDLHLDNHLSNNDTTYSEIDVSNTNSTNEKGDNLEEFNLIDSLDLSKSINQNIIYSTIEEALLKVPNNKVKSSQIPIILIKKITKANFDAIVHKSPVRTRSGKEYSIIPKVTPLEVFNEISSEKDSCDNQQQCKNKYLYLSKQKPFKSCINMKKLTGGQNSLLRKPKILKKSEQCFKNVTKVRKNVWSYCKRKINKSIRGQNVDISDTSQINTSQDLSDEARLKLYDFVDETEFELHTSKINEMEYRSKRAKSYKPCNNIVHKILKDNIKNVELSSISKSKKRSYCRNKLKNNLVSTHRFFSKKYKQSLNLISQKSLPSNFSSTKEKNEANKCKNNIVCKENLSFRLSRNQTGHEIVAIPKKKTNIKNLSQVEQNLPQDPMDNESIWSIKTPEIPGNISLVRSHQFLHAVKTSNDRPVKKTYLDNQISNNHFENASENHIKMPSKINDLIDIEDLGSKTKLIEHNIDLLNPKNKEVLCDLTNQPIETISKMTSDKQISSPDFNPINLDKCNEGSISDVNHETQLLSKEILESISPHIDIIEGIQFLSFESENDLKVYLTKNQDTSLSTLHLESPELLEFDNDILPDDTDEQVIFPTKTKDITKIKGWRKKIFTMDENMDPQQFLQLHWKTRLRTLMDMINQLHTDKTKYLNLINKKGLDKVELIKLFKEWHQQNNKFICDEISVPELNEVEYLSDANQFENQENVEIPMKILPQKNEILKPVVILKKFDISNKNMFIKKPQNARKSFPRVVPILNKTKSCQQKQSRNDKENVTIETVDISTSTVVPKPRDFEQLNPIVIPECPLQSLDMIEEASKNISLDIEQWQMGNKKFHEEALKQHQNTVSTLQTFMDSSPSSQNKNESTISSTIKNTSCNDSLEDMLKLSSHDRFDNLSLKRHHTSIKPPSKRPEKNLHIQQLLNNPPVTTFTDLAATRKTSIESVYSDMLKAKDMHHNVKKLTLPTIISQRPSFSNIQNQSSIKSTPVPTRASFQPMPSDLNLNPLCFQSPSSAVSYDMFQPQNSANNNISDPQTPCYVLLPIQCVVMNNKNVMNSSQPTNIVPDLTSTKYGKISQMQCPPLGTQTSQNYTNVNANDQIHNNNLTNSMKSTFPTSNVHIPVPQKQNNDPFFKLSHFNGSQKTSQMNKLLNEKDYLQSQQNLLNLCNLIRPGSAKKYYPPVHTSSFLSNLSQSNNPLYFSKSHNFKDNVSSGSHPKISSRPNLTAYQGLASSNRNHKSFKMYEYDQAMSNNKHLTSYPSQTYSSSKGTLLDSLLQSEKEAKHLKSSYINHMNALAKQTIRSYTKSIHPQETDDNGQKADSVIVTHQMALAAAAALDNNTNISQKTNKYTSSHNISDTNIYISDKQNKSLSQPLDLTTNVRRNQILKSTSESTSHNITTNNAFSSYSNAQSYDPNCNWQKEIPRPYTKNNYIPEPLNHATRIMEPHTLRHIPSHMFEAKLSHYKDKITHSEYHSPTVSNWQKDLPSTMSKPITTKPLLHSRPDQINQQSLSSHLKFISNTRGHMLVTVSNSDKYPQKRRNVILNTASDREAKKLFGNKPNHLYPLISDSLQLQEDNSYNQPLCLIKTCPKDEAAKARLMDIRDKGLQVTIPRDLKSFRPFLGSSLNAKNNHNFKTSNQTPSYCSSDCTSCGNGNKNTIKASLQLPITIDEGSIQYSNHSLIRNSSFPSQPMNINQKGNSISSSVKNSRLLSTPDREMDLLATNKRSTLTNQQVSDSLTLKLNQQEKLQQHYKKYCDKLINNILEEAKNHTTLNNIREINTLPDYCHEQNQLIQRNPLESIEISNPQSSTNESKDKLLDTRTTSSSGSSNHTSSQVIPSVIKYLPRFENNKEILDSMSWTFQNSNRNPEMVSQRNAIDLDVYPNNSATVEPVLYENMLSKNLGWDDKGRPIMAVKPIDNSETFSKPHIINSTEPDPGTNGKNELPSVNVQISVQALQSKTLSVQTSIHTSQMNSQSQHVLVKTNFQQHGNRSNPINFQANVETLSSASSASTKSEVNLNSANHDYKQSSEFQTPIKLNVPNPSSSNDLITSEQSNCEQLTSNKFEYLDFEVKNNKLTMKANDEIVTSVETSNKPLTQNKISAALSNDDSNYCSSEVVNQLFPGVTNEFAPPNETSLNETFNKPVLKNRTELQSPKKSISGSIMETLFPQETKYNSLSKTTVATGMSCNAKDGSVSQTTVANSLLCDNIAGLVQQATVRTVLPDIETEKYDFQTLSKKLTPHKLENKAISPTLILSSDDSMDSPVPSTTIPIDQLVSSIKILSHQELLEKSDSETIDMEYFHDSVNKLNSLTAEMECSPDSTDQLGPPIIEMESPLESVNKSGSLITDMQSLHCSLNQSVPPILEREFPRESIDIPSPPTIEMESRHESIDKPLPLTITIETANDSINQSLRPIINSIPVIVDDRLSPPESLNKPTSSTIQIVSDNESINNLFQMETLSDHESLNKLVSSSLEILPSNEPTFEILQLHACRDKPIPTNKIISPCESTDISSFSTCHVSHPIEIVQPYESITKSVVDSLSHHESLDNSSTVEMFSANEPTDKPVYSAVEMLSCPESTDKLLIPTLEKSLHESIEKVVSPIVEIVSPHESINKPIYPTAKILQPQNFRDKPVPTFEILSPHESIDIPSSSTTLKILPSNESIDKSFTSLEDILPLHKSLDKFVSPELDIISNHEYIDLLPFSESIDNLLSTTTVKTLQTYEYLDKHVPTNDESIEKKCSPTFKVVSSLNKPDSLTTVKILSSEELTDRSISPTFKILSPHKSVNKLISSTLESVPSPEPLEKASYPASIEILSSCKSMEKTGSTSIFEIFQSLEPLEKPISTKTVELLPNYEIFEKPVSPTSIRVLSPVSTNKSIFQTSIVNISPSSPASSSMSQSKVGILSHESADKHNLQVIDSINSDSVSQIAVSQVEILSHQTVTNKSYNQTITGNSYYQTIPHESLGKSIYPAIEEMLSHHDSNDILDYQNTTGSVLYHELINIPDTQTKIEVSTPCISNDKLISQNPFGILAPPNRMGNLFSQTNSGNLSPLKGSDMSFSQLEFNTSHKVTDILDFPNIFQTLSSRKVTEEIVSQIPDTTLTYNVTHEPISQMTATIHDKSINKSVSKIPVEITAATSKISDNSSIMALNESATLITDNYQPFKNNLNNSQFNGDTDKLITHVPSRAEVSNHMKNKPDSQFMIGNQLIGDKSSKLPLQIMTDRLEHNQPKHQLLTSKLVDKNDVIPSINIEDMHLNVKKCLSGYHNKNFLDNCIPSSIQEALPPEMWRALQPQIVKFITNCLLESIPCEVFPCRFLVGQNIIEVNGVSGTVLNLMKAYKHNRNKIVSSMDTLSEKLQAKNRDTGSMPIVGYLVPKSALSVQAGVTTIKSAIPVYVLPKKCDNKKGSFESDEEKSVIINPKTKKNENMKISLEKDKEKSVINPNNGKKQKPLKSHHNSVFDKEKMDNCSDLSIISTNQKILYSKNDSESLQKSNFIQSDMKMNSNKNHEMLLKKDHAECNICNRKRLLENCDLEHSKCTKRICLTNNIPSIEEKNVNNIKEKDVLSQSLTSMDETISKIVSNCSSSGNYIELQAIKYHNQPKNNQNVKETNISSRVQLCPTTELPNNVKEGNITKQTGKEMLITFCNKKLSDNFTIQKCKNLKASKSSNTMNVKNTGMDLFLNSKFHQKNYFEKYRNIMSLSNLSKTFNNIQPIVICQRLEDCKKAIGKNNKIHSKIFTLNTKTISPLFWSESCKTSLSGISKFKNNKKRSELQLKENYAKSKACILSENNVSNEITFCEKNKEMTEKDNGILSPKIITICPQENNFSIDCQSNGSSTNRPDSSLPNKIQLTDTIVVNKNSILPNCNQIHGSIDPIDDINFKPNSNPLHLQQVSDKFISDQAITTNKNTDLVSNSLAETIQYITQKHNQKLIELPDKEYVLENSSAVTIQNSEKYPLLSNECESNKRVPKIESKICISQGKQTFSVNNSAFQILKDSEGKVFTSLIEVKSNIHSHSTGLNKESINSISGESKPKVPTNWQEYKKMMGLEQQVKPIKLPPHLSNRLSNAQIKEGIVTKSLFTEDEFLDNSLKIHQELSPNNNEFPEKCNQISEKSDLQKRLCGIKDPPQISIVVKNTPDLKLNQNDHQETIENTSLWTKIDSNYEKDISSASDEIYNSSSISVSHIDSLETQAAFPNPSRCFSKTVNLESLDDCNSSCITQTEINENPLSIPPIISISIDEHQTSSTKTSHSLSLFDDDDDGCNAKQPKLDFTMHVEVANHVQPNRKHRRKSPLRSKPLPPDEQMESNDDDFYDESFDIAINSSLKDNIELKNGCGEQISITERHREFEKQRRAQQKRLFHKLSKELREDRKAFEECPNDPPAKIDILKCAKTAIKNLESQTVKLKKYKKNIIHKNQDCIERLVMLIKSFPKEKTNKILKLINNKLDEETRNKVAKCFNKK